MVNALETRAVDAVRDRKMFCFRRMATGAQLRHRAASQVAGALQLLPPGERPVTPAPDERPEPLDETGLVRVLDALPSRLLLAGEGRLRLSLAGAWSKVPVVLVDGAVALPLPGQPTTHILEPLIPRFSD